MLMLMLRAFRSACFAHIGAYSTEVSSEVAGARDEARHQAARRGAVHVEPYAVRHHLHVILFQARRGAMVAGIGA